MSNAFVVSIGALACEISRRSEFLSVASVLVFAAVLVLARIHAFFESRGSQAADDEPLIMITGPNRRNQSAIPPLA